MPLPFLGILPAESASRVSFTSHRATKSLLLTMRAREAHSGPHAPHFWDAETAGGGALLDMGCHTVESARHFFGKDNHVTEVFAWGSTMAHGDKTAGEDSAV